MVWQSSKDVFRGVRIHPSDKMEMVCDEKLILVITLKSFSWLPARPMSLLSCKKHFRFAFLICSQNRASTQQWSWVSVFIVRSFHIVSILETWANSVDQYICYFSSYSSKKYHQGLCHITAKSHQTLVTDWRVASSRGQQWTPVGVMVILVSSEETFHTSQPSVAV